MTVNVVEKIDDGVTVNTVLVSVSDKRGLDIFIPQLLDLNPELRVFSTGGTYAKLQEIIGGDHPGRLTQVADYTGQPETQGGLVKTLDFKIYLGLLTETYNAAHAQDMSRTGALPIDMVVVNLYPFGETIARVGVTVEQARANIDIGGPCMIRAAAKNYLRVASVVDPADYAEIITAMRAHDGQTLLDLRYRLARKAFAHTAAYDQAIAGYLEDRNIADVRQCYRWSR